MSAFCEKLRFDYLYYHRQRLAQNHNPMKPAFSGKVHLQKMTRDSGKLPILSKR